VTAQCLTEQRHLPEGENSSTNRRDQQDHSRWAVLRPSLSPVLTARYEPADLTGCGGTASRTVRPASDAWSPSERWRSAPRARVIRQFLTESLALAACGGLAGIGVTDVAIKLAGLLMPETSLVLHARALGLTRVAIGMIDLDLRTLLFALGTAALTAFVRADAGM
jgi:hypothetical protein